MSDISSHSRTKYNTDTDKQIKYLGLITVKISCPFYSNTAGDSLLDLICLGNAKVKNN